MSLYARVADLPLRIEGYGLEPLSTAVSSGFTRVTTVVRLRGGGEEGVGEDVCYDPPDHMAQLEAGPVLPLAGEWTLDGFSRHLEGLDLFPTAPPSRPEALPYRRWGYESAALDLALRQAGTSLGAALGVAARPVTFVVSTRLGEPLADEEPGAGAPPVTAERVLAWLSHDPALRFKLDPTRSWTPALVEELAATGAVATVDLKGCYTDTPVDGEADPDLYALVARGLPGAWIEDPRLTPATREALAGHEDRITWDAPIHSVDDIRARERVPRMINMKPSRFGTLRRLLDAHDHLAAEGIGAYGGGQFELGPGRGHIQYLASLLHPGTPNDVAPVGYNAPAPTAGLEPSPLEVRAHPTGFRWG